MKSLRNVVPRRCPCFRLIYGANTTQVEHFTILMPESDESGHTMGCKCVGENALPACNGACCTRSREAEVTQGVTEGVVKPWKATLRATLEEPWLMATIAKLPLLGSLYAETRTPGDGEGVAAMRTKPGRMNLLKFPKAYSRLVT